MYSSGTTGRPKGVMLSHRNIVAHTQNVVPVAPMGPGDRNLVAMSLFHVGGTCYALFGIYAGVPSTFTREPDPASLLAAFAAGATYAFLVPAVVSALLAAGERAIAAMGGLKYLLYGAAPMPVPVLRQALAAWPGLNFVQVYGLTELAGVISALSPQAHRDAAREDRLGSAAGTLLVGAEMRVVDPATGQDAAAHPDAGLPVTQRRGRAGQHLAARRLPQRDAPARWPACVPERAAQSGSGSIPRQRSCWSCGIKVPDTADPGPIWPPGRRHRPMITLSGRHPPGPLSWDFRPDARRNQHSSRAPPRRRRLPPVCVCVHPPPGTDRARLDRKTAGCLHRHAVRRPDPPVPGILPRRHLPGHLRGPRAGRTAHSLPGGDGCFAPSSIRQERRPASSSHHGPCIGVS